LIVSLEKVRWLWTIFILALSKMPSENAIANTRRSLNENLIKVSVQATPLTAINAVSYANERGSQTVHFAFSWFDMKLGRPKAPPFSFYLWSAECRLHEFECTNATSQSLR
jgi:hypothetical protein